MASEAELIRKTREAGKAYLKKNPKAFGGGIDSSTGIRRSSSGTRISVTTPQEEASGVTPISRQQAQATESREIQQRQQQQTQQAQVSSIQRRSVVDQTQKQRNEQFISKVSSPESRSFAERNEQLRHEKRERFRIALSESEKRQPTGKVIKGRAGEVLTGIGQAGVGIVEGGANIVTQLRPATTDPVTGKLTSPSFKFGGKIGEFRDRPATTGSILGKAVVFAPIAGGAVTQFAVTTSALGVGTAIRQTAYSVAPVKIQSGSFGALATQSKASAIKPRVISLKQTTKDGLIRRDIFGTAQGDPSVSIRSVQFSKTTGGVERGGGVTRISAPETTIQFGKVTTGTRTTLTEFGLESLGGKASVFKGQLGAPLTKLQGTGSRAVSQTFLNVRQDTTGFLKASKPGALIKSRFASISTKGSKISSFQSGDARRFIDIKQASSGVRLRTPTTKGLEISISPSTGTTASTGTKGVPSLKSIQSTKTSGFIPTPTVTQAVTKSTVSTIIPSIPKGQAKPSFNIAPTSLKPLQKQQPAPAVTTVQAQEPITKQIPAVTQSSRSRSSSRSRQVPKVVQAPMLAQIPQTRQIPRTRQVPKLQQIQKQRQINTRTGFKPSTTITQEPTPLGFKLPKIKRTSGVEKSKGFGVQLRRFGTFRTIGTGLTKRQAISRGIRAVSTGLGASIKFTGPTKITSLPGFRSSKKEQGVLIEPRKRRLSSRGEKVEIFKAKKK